jgi:hypothetical protein
MLKGHDYAGTWTTSSSDIELCVESLDGRQLKFDEQFVRLGTVSPSGITVEAEIGDLMLPISLRLKSG